MRLLVAACLSATLLNAQWFERKPAQPGRFIESVGRRAALLGHEDGAFEAWVYPIKVLRDFRLSVYVDDALEPTPLSALAETSEVHPGRVCLTHVHAAFTVRQTWVASPEEGYAAVLLDVETSRKLKFRATFLPEMKPMWPASFGGQSTGWDETAGVLTFGEGLRRFRPVVGSPSFRRISEQVGHQLPDRTVAIEFDVPASGQVPIVIAASRAVYDQALRKTAQLAAEADRRFSDLQRRTTRISAGALTRAYDWAQAALEKGWACNEGVGCGLVAGWAPAEASERPGFGWYFGGDTMMSVWAMQDYGDFAGARAALEFLLVRQRDDGKIMHELTQSAALLDWSRYPYGYYHADTTPLLLYSAAQYLAQSGDREFLTRFWPRFEKAYRFSLSIMDADGLLSNQRGGAAAVETGALSGKVARDVYLQGVWLAGLDGFARMAEWQGDSALAAESRAHLARARQSISLWFVPGKDIFAFAQLKDGSRYEANSAWQAFLLAHGGVDAEMSRRAAASLARPTLLTAWGVRLFATDSPFYNPLGYNDGSVWPFVTAQAALALFRHGQPEAGWRALSGTLAATGLGGVGYVGEYFSGDRFALGPRAVPHQLFSSFAVIHPLIEGALGLRADAMNGTLTVAPQLPCALGTLRIENYLVGASRVSGEITPGRDGHRIRLETSGPTLRISQEQHTCLDVPVLPELLPGQGS